MPKLPQTGDRKPHEHPHPKMHIDISAPKQPSQRTIGPALRKWVPHDILKGGQAAGGQDPPDIPQEQKVASRADEELHLLPVEVSGWADRGAHGELPAQVDFLLVL